MTRLLAWNGCWKAEPYKNSRVTSGRKLTIAWDKASQATRTTVRQELGIPPGSAVTWECEGEVGPRAGSAGLVFGSQWPGKE